MTSGDHSRQEAATAPGVSPEQETAGGRLASLDEAESEIVAQLVRLAQRAISSQQPRRADRMMAAVRILRSPLPAGTQAHPGLTKRQVEVAFLIAGGLTNRQIAHHLQISERTVHSHVQNILKKLMLTSRTQIAVWTALQQHEQRG